MNKLRTMGILSVFLIAGAGIASAFPIGMADGRAQGGYGGCGIDEETRDALNEAMLSGDWAAYSAKVSEGDLGERHVVVTEEVFPILSRIANLMEEVRILREQLLEEYDYEGPMVGRGQGRRMRGAGMHMKYARFAGA